MTRGLSLDSLSVYCFSSFRYFDPGERHVDRVCGEDVLLMVFDGTLRFRENGIPVEVPRGSYYIQRSGIPQQGVEPSDSPKYYYIHFHGGFSDSRADSGAAEPDGAGAVLPLSGEHDVASLFPKFKKLDLLYASKASVVELNAVFYSILSSLHSGACDSERRRLSQTIIELFTEDIARHYTLDELAKLCGYSKNHVINLFRAETGETPFAYLSRLRLESAKRLLATSKLTAAEVAVRCGFENYVNLYKHLVSSRASAHSVRPHGFALP